MAVQGPFKVACGDLFPHGVGVVGPVAPQMEFDNSAKKDNRPPVQARDKESGLPLWAVDVMDFDPDTRERTFRVKIAAQVQPVPPPAVEGLPVRPVVLDGLLLMPYVKETGGKNPDGTPRTKVAYSLRASGLSAPARAARPATAA